MKKTWIGLAAVAALGLSTAASAQAYLGVGIGATHLNTDCSGTTTCDTNDTGFKVLGGYKFHPNFAMELNYLNFGKAKATGASGGLTVSAEIKTVAIGGGVAMVGEIAPNWQGVARLGAASVKTDIAGSLSGFSAADNERSTQAYMGLGLGYTLTKGVSIDLSADFSRSHYGGDTANVRMVGLGATFTF
jgi:OOP family OmpA-OmpF porin